MFGIDSRSKNPSIAGRLVRSFLSIIILSAFVLGLTLGVKKLSTTDPENLARNVKPYLAKLHISIDEKQVGDVAGKFVERISETNLGSGVSTSRDGAESASSTSSGRDKKELFKVVVISDIHEDTTNLEKALKRSKELGAQAVFLLGDATIIGDVPTLEKVKNVLDNSGLKYYALPGDHDLAQSGGVQNFEKVFGSDHFVVSIDGYKFVALDNSFNYTTIPPDQMAWFESNIPKANFILLSQPLFTEGLGLFFQQIYMGSSNTDSEPGDPSLKAKQADVKDQGISLLNLIRSESSVKAVFAGEHHKSSQLTDPKRSSLEHYVVGAVSSTVKEYPQSVIQTPRFSVLTIFEDASYKVDDEVIN